MKLSPKEKEYVMEITKGEIINIRDISINTDISVLWLLVKQILAPNIAQEVLLQCYIYKR